MGWLVFDRKRCHISKRKRYISPIELPLQARFANRGRIEEGAARGHPMAPARAARHNGKRTTVAKPLNSSPKSGKIHLRTQVTNTQHVGSLLVVNKNPRD